MATRGLTRLAIFCILGSSLASCGGGGTSGNASPASVAALPGAVPRKTTSTSLATANPLPALTTTSDQTIGLQCSPEFTVSAGGYASCNVKWIEHINLNGGESIGGHFVASTHTFFVDNWESGFYAFDTTNPLSPTLDSVLSFDQGNLAAGVLVSAVENEETAVNDKVAFLSRTPTMDVAIIDVSNPKAMSILSTVPGAYDHTMRCVDNCAYAYGSYDGSSYTGGHLINATDPANPTMLADWSNLNGGIINVHDTTEIKPGLLATASNPVNFIDVSNPAVPTYMFSLPTTTEETGPTGLGPAQKGHVGHDVQWPRQGQDRWFLGQNEGAYVGLCAQYPPDGRTLYSYDTTGWESTHNFNMVGAYELVNGDNDEGVAGGSEEVDSHGSPSTAVVGTPEGCSAHWFDVNSNFNNGGLVVMASFAFGARLLNVAANGQIQQVGWFVPGGLADTVGVYWITDRSRRSRGPEAGLTEAIYLAPALARTDSAVSDRAVCRHHPGDRLVNCGAFL
jgi:hypothetical protein